MQVEAIEAGEGEEGGAGHRGQQVVVQGQPLQPGQTWVQEWSGNASGQHKMWYYNKCTVHVLVESVERPFKCFILTGSVILSQPPRQEDCFANLEANNIHNNQRVVGRSVCG